MKDNLVLFNFISNRNFKENKIEQLKSKLLLNDKKLIRKTFELLNDEISHLDKTQKYIYIIINCVEFLNILCKDKNFTEEEVIINRKRIKKSREALLFYSNKLKDSNLLYAANKLDEIVLDKSISLNDLIVLIKRLIDRKEDFNIIKKLLNTNKGVLSINNNELFDYTFYKSLKALDENSPDIYYYIVLLKIFYSSKIDLKKYIEEMKNINIEENEFANEIYYILYGKKRQLTEEMIYDKYGIITNLETINYIPPKNSNDSQLAITIDSDSAEIRDDALSIKKDGNKYIVGIHITDPTSIIEQNSNLDFQAMNNFSCIYLPDKQIKMIPDNLGNILSLNKNNEGKVLSMYIVINSDGNIEEYILKNNIIKIKENLSYTECDKLLNKNNNELSKMLHDLYEVSCLLEQNNKNKYDYWYKKDNNSIDKIVVTHNSDKIIQEFMVLYNYLVAKIACTSCIPYVYRTHYNSYLDNLIKKLNIKLDEESKKIVSSIYLRSKYTNLPIYHSGLHLDVYSHSTSPLRRYPDLYNQYLLHGLYFNDMNIKFDEQNHKELIEYFNQRSIELSLMASEYSRARKIKID